MKAKYLLCAKTRIAIAVDVRGRAAVASRKAAMLDRQARYYASGRVQPGIRVACRVIRIGNKFVVVEAFGVETTISPGELTREWYTDVSGVYSVGDLVVAKVLNVTCDTESGRYSVELSIKQAQAKTKRDNIKNIAPKSNYFGTVTSVHDGVIFVRLQAGANAKTKAYRTKVIPSVYDTVSFHVTRVDEASGTVMGYISRIIKRHSKLG